MLSGQGTSSQLYEVAARAFSPTDTVPVTQYTETDLENGAQEVEEATSTGQLDVFAGVPSTLTGSMVVDGSAGDFALDLPQPKWAATQARLVSRVAEVASPDGAWAEDPELTPALLSVSPAHVLKLLDAAAQAGAPVSFVGEREWGGALAYGYEWSTRAGRPQVAAIIPGIVLGSYEVDVPVTVTLWLDGRGVPVAAERRMDLIDVLEVPFPETSPEAAAVVTHVTRWLPTPALGSETQ